MAANREAPIPAATDQGTQGGTASSVASTLSWGNTLPCVATYKVLEGDKFLDQFEDADVPFGQAGTLTIGGLRFFPHTTTNEEMISLLSIEMARKFLTMMQKTFTIAKHDSATTSASIIREIAAIFGDKDKTLTDLAQVVNEEIDFPSNASQ